MLELEENKHKLITLKEKINSIAEALNINGMEAEIKELEVKTAEPGFWEDQQNSSVVLTKMKRLQNKLAKFKKIETDHENLESLNELLLIEEDIETKKLQEWKELL